MRHVKEHPLPVVPVAHGVVVKMALEIGCGITG